jgi:hypothetical protein
VWVDWDYKHFSEWIYDFIRIFHNFVRLKNRIKETIFRVEKSPESGYSAKAQGEDIFPTPEKFEMLF